MMPSGANKALSDLDDDMTAAPLESGSNSSESIDRLQELTEKLVVEVSKNRLRRKTAHAA